MEFPGWSICNDHWDFVGAQYLYRDKLQRVVSLGDGSLFGIVRWTYRRVTFSRHYFSHYRRKSWDMDRLSDFGKHFWIPPSMDRFLNLFGYKNQKSHALSHHHIGVPESMRFSTLSNFNFNVMSKSKKKSH